MEPQYIFLIIWLVVSALILTIMYRRGKKLLETFPSLGSVQVLFSEKGVSGNSRKSLKTKFGGAINILDVIVTNDELWIKTSLLFAGFSKTLNLLHKIKLTEILDIDLTKENVVISFKASDNSDTTLDLNMKKAEEFIEVIKNNTNV